MARTSALCLRNSKDRLARQGNVVFVSTRAETRQAASLRKGFASDQVVQFQRAVPAFPRLVKLLLHEPAVGGAVLRFQRLLQPEQRTRIARVPGEVITKYL